MIPPRCNNILRLARLWIIVLLSLLSSTKKSFCSGSSPSSNSLGPSAVPTKHNNNNNNNGNNKDGFVQVLETEVWDASQNAWRASGGRWSNEDGGSSLSPSEVEPPEGFAFVGDWKIVVTVGDSMGWEYQFQYLRPPKRRRIWLRSLKLDKKVAPVVVQEEEEDDESKQLTTKAKKRRKRFRKIRRVVSRVRDDYNFKGFGLSLTKSLIFPSSFGFSLRLPMSTNFEFLDANPAFPRVTSSIGFFYPWTVGAFLSGSVHVEWVKWVANNILVLIPRLILLIVYQTILPVLWMMSSALIFPFRRKMPPIPQQPRMAVPKPKYNPEVSERMGCTVSYRWSAKRGLEWRFSYWHSYLPTLEVYRRYFSDTPKTTVDFWQRHFAALGVNTGYPIPSPPHVSCSATLSLSGLYFKKASSILSGSSFTTNKQPQIIASTTTSSSDERRSMIPSGGSSAPPLLPKNTSSAGLEEEREANKPREILLKEPPAPPPPRLVATTSATSKGPAL